MQGGALGLAVVHGAHIGLVGEEIAVCDGLGDAGQVLKHHPAGADVGVAHLAVAHLPLGQAHVQAGGGQLTAGIFRKEPVQVGLFGVGDGVAGGLGPEAEAVHDDQSRRCFFHRNLKSSV